MRIDVNKLKEKRCYILLAALLLVIALLFIILSSIPNTELKYFDLTKEGYCSDSALLTVNNVDKFVNVYKVYEKSCELKGELLLTITNRLMENGRSVIGIENNGNFRLENTATSNKVDISVYALTNVDNKQFVIESSNIRFIDSEDNPELYFEKKFCNVKSIYFYDMSYSADIKLQYYVLVTDAEK